MNELKTELLFLTKSFSRYLAFLQEEGIEAVSITDWMDKTPGPLISNAEEALEKLKLSIGDCKRCKLHQSRSNLVFGEGNPDPDLVLVGEGPGFDEDRWGRPFVGAAGQLLNRIVKAMGLTREQIYICNVVKCHPPKNRDPEEDEIEICGNFLIEQLEILKPKMILALGRISGRFLTGSPPSTPISALRNRFFSFRGIDTAVTYHPSALLRNPAYRRPVWEDVQAVMKRLERPIPIP